MKRKGHLYNQILTHNNLRLAFFKSVKGKQQREEVIQFKKAFDSNINALHSQLKNHQPDVGHYRFFTVKDPKERNVCAADFPERVIHHAIMNIAEPILDAYLIDDSYACRKKKGTRKTVLKAKAFSVRHDWYLKMDIRKYFDSIDHEILLKQLTRKFKDKELIELFQRILGTYHTQKGKGLPIGNLVSQHFANFYLATFDHWIKEEKRIKGYLRYMDDFIVFGNDKETLKNYLKLIRNYLADTLELKLKEPIQLNQCKCGIPFLGYRIFPNCIKLSPSSKKRFIRKFKLYENNYLKGKWTEDELLRYIEPLIEFTKLADSATFRQSVITRFRVLS